MILSEKILMVEPRGFSFNPITSTDNFFQNPVPASIKFPAETALREFHELKTKLMRAGITVIVISPKNGSATPDAVFPNNWFSTTPGGQFILYPMLAENRRMERNKEIIDRIKSDYKDVIDLTPLEKKNIFLEGTGSLVLDHERKIAYASLSKRTSKEAVNDWCEKLGYEAVLFTSFDKDNEVIYHTNVVLALCNGFAIVCLDAVRDQKERDNLQKKLSLSHELIPITIDQMHSFCGNCLALKNSKGENFIVMSSQAYQAFTEGQKKELIRQNSIIYSTLNTIETIGGGSARCMMAELF